MNKKEKLTETQTQTTLVVTIEKGLGAVKGNRVHFFSILLRQVVNEQFCE